MKTFIYTHHARVTGPHVRPRPGAEIPATPSLGTWVTVFMTGSAGGGDDGRDASG